LAPTRSYNTHRIESETGPWANGRYRLGRGSQIPQYVSVPAILNRLAKDSILIGMDHDSDIAMCFSEQHSRAPRALIFILGRSIFIPVVLLSRSVSFYPSDCRARSGASSNFFFLPGKLICWISFGLRNMVVQQPNPGIKCNLL
jgi:hypothetical protein